MRRHYSDVVARPVRDVIFPRRIGRMEYFIRGMILAGFWTVSTAVLNSAVTDGGLSRNIGVGLLVLLLVLQIGFGLGGVIRPRVRDVGWNPAWSWLAVLPIVGVLLCLVLLATGGRRE